MCLLDYLKPLWRRLLGQPTHCLPSRGLPDGHHLPVAARYNLVIPVLHGLPNHMTLRVWVRLAARHHVRRLLRMRGRMLLRMRRLGGVRLLLWMRRRMRGWVRRRVGRLVW